LKLHQKILHNAGVSRGKRNFVEAGGKKIMKTPRGEHFLFGKVSLKQDQRKCGSEMQSGFKIVRSFYLPKKKFQKQRCKRGEEPS